MQHYLTQFLHKASALKNSLWGLIFLVLLFSMGIRLILAYQTADSAWHIYDNKFIAILSPDPALYGYYATLLLQGLPHKTDVSLIEYVIFFLVKITPFSLDTILYFGPALFASLVAIPTILILRLYTSSSYLLFFAGCISALGYGYYSRTYLGYFDTDVLNTFFPLMIVYSMILTIKKQHYFFAIITVLLNITYLFWYHSSEPLVYAMNGFFILFVLIFHFKAVEFYKVSILLGVSIIKLAFFYKIALLFALFVLFYFIKINYKYFLGLFIVALIVVLYKIDGSLILHHLNRYLFKKEVFEVQDYSFLYTMNLVAESTTYEFKKFIELISGNVLIFLVSILGYAILCIKHKNMLLALPLLGLGFLGLEAGIRFFIYGVPVLILGYVYFIVFIQQKIEKEFLKNSILVLLLIVPLFENYQSIKYWNTNVAVPVFTPQQIQVLSAVKKQAKSTDFFVTWWDHGWPLWYYTGMKTLIDNGKHHQDNYVVSRIFMSDSQAFSNHAIHLFYETYKKYGGTSIQGVLKNHKDLDKVFTKLYIQDLIKDKTSEKFIFIPFQMLNSLYTMYEFSNLNIKTGERYPKNIFLERTFIKEDDDKIYLSNEAMIDKPNGFYVSSNNERFYIKNIHNITQKGREKKIKTNKGHKEGLEVIIYNKKFYIMDDKFFNSLFTQLFFFDNFDENYFEQLFSTDQMKLYRVK